jgi:hypothetical protein
MAEISYFREVFVNLTTGKQLLIYKEYRKKVNVYLSSLIIKVPDHLYVLG